MGRIHVLSEAVANKIAAGEVVERPASVVKELLENSLDAGSRRIRIQVEAGGKKLIQITDDGCGMVRDDALLAFERHATSKLKNAEDLLSVATLGFRGEALPSIASVSRLRLETRAPDEASGTIVEINGGKIFKVEEAGLPAGTSITIRDLFFNTPARKKFLKAESTELSHIASLVTHYALAHPDKHFELHSATNAMLVAPPVAGHGERVYQVFGKDVLDQLIPIAALQPLERIGLPQPPPWRRTEEDEEPKEPGELRLHGFVSKPEIQKLNRNSIYIFVNGRLIRDRLVQHAITEAYRNVIPPTVFPVVLLFLEMPTGEVDVNVHPSKTEVRFRQQTFLHDFIRDSIRAVLMKARPVPQFVSEIHAHPTAGASLTPGAHPVPGGSGTGQSLDGTLAPGGFTLRAPEPPAVSQRFQFQGGIAVEANAAVSLARVAEVIPDNGCSPAFAEEPEVPSQLAPSLATLKPLGQIRESFILAVNHEGLWIIDQHVAHERVLFEKVLKQRAAPGGREPAFADAAPARTHARTTRRLRRNFGRTRSQRLRGRALRHAQCRGQSRARRHRRWPGGTHAARTVRAALPRRSEAQPGRPPHPHRGFHRLPRRHQGQHAPRPEQNGMAPGRTRENRIPHLLPARKARRPALFHQRHPARFQKDLRPVASVSLQSRADSLTTSD